MAATESPRTLSDMAATEGAWIGGTAPDEAPVEITEEGRAALEAAVVAEGTGEVVERVLSFEDMSDDTLLGFIDGQRVVAEDAKQKLQQAELTMMKRMEDRDAVWVDGEFYEARLKPGLSKWEYNTNGLMELKDHLRPELFDLAVQTVVKPNKSELNKLSRLGGKVAEIIDQNCWSTPGVPKLEIIPKARQAD